MKFELLDNIENNKQQMVQRMHQQRTEIEIEYEINERPTG